MARTCLSSSNGNNLSDADFNAVANSCHVSSAIVNGVPCCMVLTCHWRVMTCRRRKSARCLRHIAAEPMQWNSLLGQWPLATGWPLGKSRMGISFAMSESGQHSSRNDVVHPRCWWCWKPMVLKRVYPTRLDHYNGKFECETCGRTKKRVIRIESPSISPAKSARG